MKDSHLAGWRPRFNTVRTIVAPGLDGVLIRELA
jgi:hypothetical protein